jgi:pimeloyl-ACP methyl ester carboxylesterase
MERQEIVLHGHRASYRLAGSGPALVLLHGIAGSSDTWRAVMPHLAERYTVLAPDLIGHGASGKPDGDYSLGAYASSVRDLMDALGIRRATLLGHSLGGGVALQFAYQFPERCERLVLVSSGGLGRELHAVLRAGVLPGADTILPWLCVAGRQSVGRLADALGRFGLRAGPDLEETWRSFVGLEEPGARRAFLHTVRGLVDLRGQRVTATDRLALAGAVPVLIVWGEKDPLIPVAHARETHARLPGSRLEVFAESGHFPHLDEPERFTATLFDFLRGTKAVRRAAGRSPYEAGRAAGATSNTR